MPEYVFRQNANDYGLYTLFYHYFTKRWESPENSEYDLETDELIYRESNGDEMRRGRFPRSRSNDPATFCHAIGWADLSLQDR